MIEPVNNQNYYNYNKITKGVTPGADQGEAFSLAYQHKDQNQKQTQDLLEENGVRVDLSTAGRGNKQESTASGSTVNPGSWEETVDFSEGVKQAQNFLHIIRETLSTFFTGVKDAIVRFWNAEELPAKDEAGIEETVLAKEQDELELPAREPSWEVMQEQMMPKEEEEQKAIAARNTDLLTQYDRSGRIVQVNGADRTRILKGDVGRLSG